LFKLEELQKLKKLKWERNLSGPGNKD
jgi:hypothetical protein